MKLNELLTKKNIRTLKIGLLYFFLIAGGLWHVLGQFQTLMRILAAPIIIGLTTWIFWEYAFDFNADENKSAIPNLNRRRRQLRSRFFIWVILVLILSFIIEWVGVKTGKIFGAYFYGQTLQPHLFSVPLAIGFAWVVILLSTIAILQTIVAGFSKYNILLKAGLVALGMVIFDAVMEPAAIKLDYWVWTAGKIPLQNYLGWFVFSFLFAVLGFKMGLFLKKLPPIAFHAFFAQMIYFGMSGLS